MRTNESRPSVPSSAPIERVQAAARNCLNSCQIKTRFKKPIAATDCRSSSVGHTYALLALVALICSVQLLADCRKSTISHPDDYDKSLSRAEDSMSGDWSDKVHEDDDNYHDHPDHPDTDKFDFDEAKSRASPWSDAGSKTTTTSKAPKSSERPSLKTGSSRSTSAPSKIGGSTTKKTGDKTKEMEKKKMDNATNSAADASAAAKSSKPAKVKLDSALKQLHDEGKRVESKRNNTIIINGRKFNQVNPIECVDEQFYTMLMKDLALINPAETHDEYETYYDSERAKAIGAIVDAPAMTTNRKKSAIGRQMAAAAGKSRIGDLGGSRAEDADNIEKSMSSQQLLNEIRQFWQETNRTYIETSKQLNLKFSRRKRAAKKSKVTTTAKPVTAKPATPKPTARATPPKNSTTKPTFVKPNYRRALENHYYLMKRLEELKTMLLNGEEAIIILNNRVKKLQQAVGEDELHQALCSCITSRGGRAALMLISELFTDKNAIKMLTKLDEAKRKSEAAARDTAEFCSYWYGDTLRSQAIMKEKQIKRLIMKIKKETMKKTEQTTETVTTTSIKYISNGTTTKRVVRRETRVRVVTKVVEMTRLWRPELSGWIQDQLGANFTSDLNVGTKRDRRHVAENPEMFMSTPFDHSSLYTDVDDGEDLESSDIVKSFIMDNYQPSHFRARRQISTASKPSASLSIEFTTRPGSTIEVHSKSTTKAPSESTTKGSKSSSTTKPKKNPSTTQRAKSKPSKTSTRKSHKSTRKPKVKSTTSTITNALKTSSTGKPTSVKSTTSTTTNAPKTSSTRKPTSDKNMSSANFEERTSRSASKCAIDGFSVLLDIAYDENAILYETSRIKRDNNYIKTLRDSYIASFSKYWIEMRDEWSRKFMAQTLEKNKQSADTYNMYVGGRNGSKPSKETNMTYISSERLNFSFSRDEFLKKTETDHSSSGDKQAESLKKSTRLLNTGLSESSSDKSVDELIDDALETTGDAYERGARLGYTIGKFIGEKSARQWPDPVELNTFTYDSLFLAGVGHNYSEQQTKDLENLIVTETAKRVAFSEANRKAFAKALHSAYLNGAFIVPKFGVLHGQRAVAKRASTEGAQIGYEAASKAAADFTPSATKFFRLHAHQRALAAPYKRAELGQESKPDKKGLIGRVDEVKKESDLNANINRIAIECGQKSGALMGAIMGLLVVPEAFETYARVRGSLEAVEGEFYRYKLGALRGYELGESWALLNYTNAMAKRLDSFRQDIGKVSLDTAKNSTKLTKTTTTTKKPRKKKLKRKNITHIPDDNLLRTIAETDPLHTNVNNVFQFMVVNYGERLVANHSKESMLVFRSLVGLDDNMVTDMKIQSGDLIDTGKALRKKNDKDDDDDDDDVFESVKVAGELDGSLSSSTEKGKKFPLKLEIIDLGPIIEFADESSATRGAAKNKSSGSLEVIPLTEALSKVNKIYIKLRVAKHNDTPAGDELETYLNADQTDSGDGFICGSYSQLGASRRSQVPSATNSQLVKDPPRETQDDLALEAAILDELYERVERLSSGKDAILETEQAMRVTTVAPAKIAPIKTTFAPTKATLAANKTVTTTPKTPKFNGTKLPVTKAPTTSSKPTKAASSTTKKVASGTVKMSSSKDTNLKSRSSLDEDLVANDEHSSDEKTPNGTLSKSNQSSRSSLEDDDIDDDRD